MDEYDDPTLTSEEIDDIIKADELPKVSDEESDAMIEAYLNTKESSEKN